MGEITREDRIVIKALRVATQQPGLKPGGLCHLGSPAVARVVYHGRKFETWNNWSRRSCWSGAQSCTVTEVHWWQYQPGEWWTYWTRSSTSCRHLYSSIVVCWRRCKRWTICRSATYDFFQVVCLWQSCWSYVAPSSVLKCLLWQNLHKICITLLAAVCSLHVPKIIEFYLCIQMLPAKM